MHRIDEAEALEKKKTKAHRASGKAVESFSLSIPYAFIGAKTRLSWQEALFGLDKELLKPGAVIDLAASLLEKDGPADTGLVALASLSPEDPVRPYLEQLVVRYAPEKLEAIQAKWLYLVLSWLYERRNEYNEPLKLVELVYSDFHYPEAIRGFVRYMPSDEPDLGPKLNIERLYRNWKEYLDEAEKRFGPSP